MLHVLIILMMYMHNGLLTIITQHMMPIQRSQYSLVKLKVLYSSDHKINIVVSLSCGCMYVQRFKIKRMFFHTIIIIVPKSICILEI